MNEKQEAFLDSLVDVAPKIAQDAIGHGYTMSVIEFCVGIILLAVFAVLVSSGRWMWMNRERDRDFSVVLWIASAMPFVGAVGCLCESTYYLILIKYYPSLYIARELLN